MEDPTSMLTREPMDGQTAPEKAPDTRDADDVPLAELWLEDFVTHDRQWQEPGFWAVAVHRLGTRAERAKPLAVRKALSVTHGVLSTAIDWIWGIHLPKTTRVGRRLRIWHHGSILLNARAIGHDVHIRQDTTFGPVHIADAHRPECLPVIGDGVDIGSGACVMGAVSLGKGAFVGANSVVLQSVPAGAKVFGVPARILPK